MDSCEVEFGGRKDFGPCECCGNNSTCVWGYVYRSGRPLASYFVHWTIGDIDDHYPNFDIILGPWGEGTSSADRKVVSLQYRLLENGPAFMVIDAVGRPIAAEGANRALLRTEVIEQPIAVEAYEVADTILAKDHRISELLGDWVVE